MHIDGHTKNGSSGRYDTGVIHGRFQVLHNDHLVYLLSAKALCDHLVIGITNPDPQLTRDDETEPERSGGFANPLTFYERLLAVRAAMTDSGVDLCAFTIVPLPINLPQLYRCYVPTDAVFFLTIYDDWGRKKLALFESQGLKTHVMWQGSKHDKGISGTRVRSMMLEGGDWQALVPPSVVRLMLQWRVPERLQAMNPHTPAWKPGSR